MRYPVYRLTLAVSATMAIIVGIAAALVVLLVYTSPSNATHTCTGTNIVDINPGDDLDAIVNADLETTATTFCVHRGTYTIDQTVTLNSGDQIEGQSGRRTSVGPATKPVPRSKLAQGLTTCPDSSTPKGLTSA